MTRISRDLVVRVRREVTDARSRARQEIRERPLIVAGGQALERKGRWARWLKQFTQFRVKPRGGARLEHG